MHAVRAVPELFAASSAPQPNPVEVIIAETKLGRGVLGVVDGELPLGIEEEEDQKKRKGFLRMIGYKL